MADTNFIDATASIPGTLIESSWLNDANTATYSVLNTVVGTNAITANGPSTVTAYASGQNFRFLPVAANTGAVTINITGIGVVAVTKYGTTPLVAGDIVSGSWAYITYDGTRFQLNNPATSMGRLINVRSFFVTGVYTPTAGTNSIIIEIVGGGGGGGGSAATGAGQLSCGGGGGGGGYCRSYITSGFSGQTITIGAPGGSAAGTAGTAGTATTFMVMTAAGGGGGGLAAAGAVTLAAGGTGGTSTGGILLNIAGGAGGECGASFAASLGFSGFGGDSMLGIPGAAQVVSSGLPGTNGANASGFGAGGGGGRGGASTGASAGGNGTQGVAIIYEYS